MKYTACINVTAKEIELKSSTAEKAVIDLINIFMDTVTQPDLQMDKYNWMDPERAVKPVGSSSKLLMGEDAGISAIHFVVVPQYIFHFNSLNSF